MTKTDASPARPAPRPLAFALDAGPGNWAGVRKDGAAAYQKAVDRTIELASIADRAGIDSLWALEDPDGWDSFTVLAAMARVTERIKLGTGVTNPYYRHPSLLAASVSTLDALSNGRAFLGLGRGQTEWYERSLGMHVGKPLHALNETIDLLRQWWMSPSTATSSPDATEFHINAWKRVISPEQAKVPIYLAAAGPLAQRLAGQKADGILFNDLSSSQYMAESVNTVRAAASAAGRDPDNLRFCARTAVLVTDDPGTVYERRKSTVATINALPGMERILATPGFDIDQIIADVRKAMRTDEILARGGAFTDLRIGGDLAAAKRAIPFDLMHELVIAGTARDIRERLATLQEIGITDVFLAGQGPEVTLESLSELLASLR
ncbi:MAG: LLM class flavin-dependent oxidoreductase [Thermomicrobiales bacterium]